MNIDMDEIDEFVRRAEEVERQVKALMPTGDASGEASTKLELRQADSSVVVVPSSEKNQDAEKTAAQAAVDRENSKRWAAEIAAREAVEERERWWKLAFYSKNRYLPEEGEESEPKSDRLLSPSETDAKIRSVRYTGPDYTRWNQWVKSPDDPVTKEEMRVAEEAREKAQNDAFEAANQGFVTGFKADMDKRAAGDAAKAKRSEALRASGNAEFKAGSMAAALALYCEALTQAPLQEATLTNIAAAHLALGNSTIVGVDAAASAAGHVLGQAARHFALAIEYCTRTLWLSPGNAKALWRRAQACLALEKLCPLDDAPSSAASLRALLDRAGVLSDPPSDHAPASSAGDDVATSAQAVSGFVVSEDSEQRAARKSRQRRALLFATGWREAGLGGLLVAAARGGGALPAAAAHPAASSPWSWLRQSERDMESGLPSAASDAGRSEVSAALARVRIELAEHDRERRLLRSSDEASPCTPGGQGTSSSPPSAIISELATAAAQADAASVGAGAASPSSLLLPLGGEQLRLVAAALAAPESSSGSSAVAAAERLAVQARSSSLLERLVSAVTATASFLLPSAAKEKGALQSTGSEAPRRRLLLHPAAIGPALTVLAGAASGNSKNRLLVLDGGVIQAVGRMLVAAAEALSTETAQATKKCDGAVNVAAAIDGAFHVAVNSLFALPAATLATPPAAASASPRPELTFHLHLPSFVSDAVTLLDVMAQEPARSAAGSGDGLDSSSRVESRLLVCRCVGLLQPNPAAAAGRASTSAASAVAQVLLAAGASVAAFHRSQRQQQEVLAHNQRAHAEELQPVPPAVPYPAATVTAAAGCAVLVQHLALDSAQPEVRAALAKPGPVAAAAAAGSIVAALLTFLQQLVKEPSAALADVRAARSAAAASGAAVGSGIAGSNVALAAADEAILTSLTAYPVQVAVGALANLAQIESLRPAFVPPPPAPATARSGAAAASTGGGGGLLSPLLCLLRIPPVEGAPAAGIDAAAAVAAASAALPLRALAHPLAAEVAVVRGSALAALANASLGAPALVDALVAAGAVPTLLSLLPDALAGGGCGGSGGGQGAPALLPPMVLPLEVVSRAALLLGRLAAHAAALSPLRQEAALGQLLALLCTALRARGSASDCGTAAAAASVPSRTSSSAVARMLRWDVAAGWLAPLRSAHAAPASEAAASTTAAAVASVQQLLATVIDSVLRVLAAVVSVAASPAGAAAASATAATPPDAAAVLAFERLGGLPLLAEAVTDIIGDNWSAPAANGAGAAAAAAAEAAHGLRAIAAAPAAPAAPTPLSSPPAYAYRRLAALGNACKVGINLAAACTTAAAAGGGGGIALLPPARLVSAGVVDALVEALRLTAAAPDADATALAARRNAAVALAKLTRDAGCTERIRTQRGMEMLMAVYASVTKAAPAAAAAAAPH